MKCKIVVGANYGDEGKGMVTHTLTKNCIDNNEKVLNVLYNGGCQRGHTVEYEDYKHVFKHFGSGTLDGSDTYFNKDFMLNPTQFVHEYNELKNVTTRCFCHRDCRVSTPYDALLNQMIETNRGNKRHGSCGWGIFETRRRYEDSLYNWTFLEMRCATNEKLFKYLESIAKEYVPKMIELYGIKDSVIAQFRNICIDSNLIIAYIEDFRSMCKLIDIVYFGDLIKRYDTVIYEAGQGLALSETNKDGFPHLTPSKTGCAIPVEEISPYTDDIEVCYVTRTYITRHGAGKLHKECDKCKINADIVDETNIPNEYQKSLRFAPFILTDFISRVAQDGWLGRQSLYITHWNYNKLSKQDMNHLRKYFNNVLIVDRFGGTLNEA